MNRHQIQILRYISLFGTTSVSARTMGLYRAELSPLHEAELVTFGLNGYGGGRCSVTTKGQAFLKSLGAHTFANPEWDDRDFASLLERPSLHEARLSG